jgi:hypothetical protein
MRLAVYAGLAGAVLALTSSAAAEGVRAWTSQPAPAHDGRPFDRLSAWEVAALIDLDRRIRARSRDPRTAREKCVDQELDSLGRPPTRLALRIIGLKCSQQ